MPSAKKTYEEKLAEIQEKKAELQKKKSQINEELQKKQNQLKEREKRIIAQHSKEERKKRTKRLIELGGAICKVWNDDTVEGDVALEQDIANIITFLKSQNERGNYFTKATNRTPKPKDEQIKEKIAISPSKSDDDEMPF